ncbi:hypothetical protein BRADI_5g15355v3 [Brachypodium distachyon]|uniref:Uncharacterized protein n=1 Tax=Brachypodium distachyon TaxID=15368 RepID=A0A0Q3GR94_BRADI|nr:hypothetical protein BRADI_5g15355v3 [Brachypodium distachyon]
MPLPAPRRLPWAARAAHPGRQAPATSPLLPCSSPHRRRRSEPGKARLATGLGGRHSRRVRWLEVTARKQLRCWISLHPPPPCPMASPPPPQRCFLPFLLLSTSALILARCGRTAAPEVPWRVSGFGGGA